MSKLFEQLLSVRGLTHDFLDIKYENLTNPMLLPDMTKAVDRLRQAVRSKEKIIIFGDYDADGVTASTVMEQTLRLIGIPEEHIEIMLPSRFTDGYGMSKKLVQRAKDGHQNLVITVDCGSRNLDIIAELKRAHIDTIVTDHHELGEELPDCVAVINPKRHDYIPTNQVNELAGVGVAFKLAQALAHEGMMQKGQEKWLLDLVLIGTICDSMLLVGENRILCHYGFIVLEKTKRKGLKELMRLARVKNLNSEAIGFQIGPRLNAAGRLEDATLALRLLQSTSPTEAASLAMNLDTLNQRRKIEQKNATDEIRARGISHDPVLVEVGDWHEGILGIIAGRLVETFKHPAFVLSETENGILKGSGRSFGDFSLAEALNHTQNSIIGGGGHASAAGVRLYRDQLDNFRTELNNYYASLNLKDQTHYLNINSDLTLKSFDGLTLDFLTEMQALEPYGAGNEEPIFCLEHPEIVSARRLGTDGQHLRLDLEDAHGRSLKLISFYSPENWLTLTPGRTISPLIKLTENEFNGIKSLEGRIYDIKME